MSKFKKSDILLLLIVLLAYVPGLLVFQQLPAQVPSHWDINGQVNGYSSKITTVVFMPSLNLALYFLFLIIPKIDPKRANYQNFGGAYSIIRWALHLFLMGTYLFTLYNALAIGRGQKTPDVSGVILGAVALLFIVLGNYMGRFRHNYFVGIRTPWTLASEEVWQKTHRLAGKLYVGAGIIALSGLFIGGMVRFWLFMVPIIGANLLAMGYSFWLYQKTQVHK